MPLEDVSKTVDELLSSAVKVLQSPMSVPGYSGTDLTAARRESTRAAATRDEASTVIDDSKTKMYTATEDQKAALDRQKVAERDSANADQERAQAIANTTLIVGGDVFGGGTKDEIARNAAILTKAIVDARPELDAALAEIQKLNQADNPLDWLTNQFILPSKVAAYNAKATQVNAMQNTLDNALATSEAIVTFANKGVPTITAAQAKAKADKAAAIIDVEKAKADEALAKTNVEFAVRKLAGDLSIANQTIDMTRIQQEENKMKYQSAINAINLADTHANRLMKAASLLEQIEKTKGLDVILKNYDRVMGHPDGTTNRFMFERFSDSRKQDMVAIGAGSMGADPYTGMLTFFNNRPGPQTSPDTARLFSYIKDKADTIALTAKVQATDEKQKPAAIARELRRMLDEEIVSSSKQGSLFYELSPAAVIAGNDKIANSPIGKALEPLAKSPGTVPTEVIISTLTQTFKNPTDAGAAIAAYYQNNIAMRNTVMNTNLIGVKLPTSYVIRDSVGMFGFNKIPFDLTKPEDATKYVLLQRQKLINQANRGSFTSSGGNQGTLSNTPSPFTLPNVSPDNLSGGQE